MSCRAHRLTIIMGATALGAVALFGYYFKTSESTGLPAKARAAASPWLAQAAIERRGGPERCVTCHENNHVAPWATQEWRDSRHAVHGVDCIACHGDFHATVSDKRVSPAVCGKCHEKEAAAFARGRHSQAMSKLVGHPEFVRQSESVAVRACEACHGIGAVFSAHPAANDLNGRCNSCHTGHSYKAVEAAKPDACTACHSGAAERHAELIEGSVHARAFRGKNACLVCHDPHDDSWRVRNRRSDANVQRERMIAKCSACHLRSSVVRSLQDADAIKLEADASLDEIRRLFPDQPNLGRKIDAGGRAAALFYDASKRHHPMMWRAGYHQSPAAILKARRELDRARAEIAELLKP